MKNLEQSLECTLLEERLEMTQLVAVQASGVISCCLDTSAKIAAE